MRGKENDPSTKSDEIKKTKKWSKNHQNCKSKKKSCVFSDWILNFPSSPKTIQNYFDETTDSFFLRRVIEQKLLKHLFRSPEKQLISSATHPQPSKHQEPQQSTDWDLEGCLRARCICMEVAHRATPCRLGCCESGCFHTRRQLTDHLSLWSIGRLDLRIQKSNEDRNEFVC